VLFLAVGDYRRRAVSDEATAVLREGGAATILLNDRTRWEGDTLPVGVEIVELPKLEREHLPLRIERGLVFELPRQVFMLASRGRLKSTSDRAHERYERRLAKPVHRRVLRLYNRMWPDYRHAQIMSRLIRPGRYDSVEVTDYVSMPYGARILNDIEASPELTTKLSFGIDHV
jgi:hypothetical protein